MVKRIFITLLVLVVAALLSVYLCNSIIEKQVAGKTYYKAGETPYNKVGLLLGTAKFLESGSENPYYTYRIDATLELYRAGKIKYIIISGDNSRKEYNEPQMMKDDLMKAGIDSSKIFLDYAGFRTFDSMVRLREIFNQHSVTVISQRFHNERAIYIAHREGISAIGYNADDVRGDAGMRIQMRELLARVKVFVDYVTGVDPKFLGPPVPIP